MENLKKLALAFLPLVLCGILWIFLKAPQKPEAEVPVAAPERKAPAAVESGEQGFETETHWLVHEIGRSVEEVLGFASGKPEVSARFRTERVDTERFKFLVGGEEGLSFELALAGYLWSPENYVPWAKACIDHWKIALPPAGPAATSDLRSALTNPTPEVLAERAKAVSQILTSQPLSADAHEQAALLVGTFSLREAAGMFQDPRNELNRIAAHLALARAIRPEPGPDGVIANLILLTLVGRQEEALAGIDQLPAEDKAWARALRWRNTGDWRSDSPAASLSRLEKIELARALNSSVGAAKVIALLEEIGEEPGTDWNRIVMQRNFGVEEGHLFVRPSFKAELEQFKDLHQRWTGQALRDEDLVKTLNTPPGGPLRVDAGKSTLEAISWGSVAAFSQRHMCQSLAQTYRFFDDKYSVPEAAAEMKQQASAYFDKLDLYPLLWQNIETPSDETAYRKAVEASVVLCEERPMLVTARNWVNLRERKDAGPRPPVPVPSPNPWFTPDLPLGTAFDFANRYYDLHRLYTESDEFWDQLIAIAPFDYDVIRTHRYKKFGANPTPEQILQCFEPIKAYHVLALREYADKLKDDPDAYVEAMKPAIELDPDLWIKIGSYLVEKNRPELALDAFENGFEKATDRVLVSNNVQWLVDYYFENNRKEDALKIATEAAETYSNQGLETMGTLRERLGELDEAEKVYQSILERYDDPAPLAGLYARHQATKTDYKAKLESMIPGGLQKASLADFTDPPIDGCVFTSDSNALREHGLKPGDVVVALDGFRVTDVSQFMTIRSLSNRLPMHLIYWNGNGYRELEASPPERRFQCDIDNYSK